MKDAALGIRVHSGWGALVGISGERGAEEVIVRCRIDVTDPGMRGAIQPYHYVERFTLQKAEDHIAKCAAASHALALSGIWELGHQLEDRGYRVAGAAILLSSGRALPELSKILAAHPLIHTAEGEFFRAAFRNAFETAGIRVTGIPERELGQRIKAVFGAAAPRLEQRIVEMRRTLGPPWTTDQKTAALAATIVLAESAMPYPAPAFSPAQINIPKRSHR